MKWQSVLTSALVLSVVAAAPPRAQTVQTPVPPLETTGGMLAGKILPSGVKAWLGVPFAAPPVDGLRWTPPRPMHWRGVWNADRLMPECIQVLRPHDINHYFGEEATSEDCLYLNIWAPATAHVGSNLPVIVFIYGGGFTIGSSGIPLYGGEPIAKTGRAIFVNFNYRLGILGFMAHPQLTREQGGHSGNYGYLDQNAALKWVHNNIAQMGGDPNKVIIMGQSAGAMSVAAQVFSPLSRGLFRGAVMSSGCIWTDSSPLIGSPQSLADGETIGLEVQRRLGAADLEALRQVPADKILAIQSEFQVGHKVEGVRAGPIIDGYFTPATKRHVFESHQLSDVPIIASFNGADLDAFNPLVTAKTVADYRAIAARMYGSDAPEFLRLFPVHDVADIRKVGIVAAREADLEQSARDCAKLQHQYDRSPAYIDMFSLEPSFAPGVKIADLDPVTAGAYHTADIPFWLGTQNTFNLLRTTRAWTPWDRALSADMMGSLIHFAATGNPGTARVKWPAWKPANDVKIVFGKSIHVVPFDTKRMAWLAAHPAKPVMARAPSRPRPHD